MTFAIFKLIYSLIGLSMIGFYYLVLKVYPNSLKNLFDRRSGIICSKCSVKTISADDLTMDILKRVDNFQLCLSCRRDTKLNNLLSLSIYKDLFDNWVMSKRSEKIMLVAIIVPLPFLIFSIFIDNQSYSDFTSLFNSSMMILYWSIMIYRIYLCRK